MSRILLTRDRQCAGAHPSQRWQFVRDERGVYVREVIDVNRLTPQEQAACDAYTPEFEAYMEQHSDEWAPEEQPRFLLIGVALQWARLMDEEVTVAAEMAAFGAPSECATQAYKSIEERRELLLLQAVN